MRSTSATRSASSSSGDRRLRPSARCEPIERRRRRGRTGRASTLFASACRCRAAARPSSADEHRLVDTGELADRRDAAGAQLLRRHPADAPDALDRQRVEELQLARERHDEQAVGLRERARHLREELRARDADADRQPDPLADLPPQPDRDLDGRACDPLHPADVEERLVDRQPFDERRRVVEHGVERLARLRVGGHAGRDDDRLAGRAGAPPGRPSPSGCRTPSPRSSPRAPPRRRRSPGGRAGEGRRAARPTRRTSPRRRAGSSPQLTRTYVRMNRRADAQSLEPGSRSEPDSRVAGLGATTRNLVRHGIRFRAPGAELADQDDVAVRIDETELAGRHVEARLDVSDLHARSREPVVQSPDIGSPAVEEHGLVRARRSARSRGRASVALPAPRRVARRAPRRARRRLRACSRPRARAGRRTRPSAARPRRARTR